MPNQRWVGNPNYHYPVTVSLVADPNGQEKMMFCHNCQAPFTAYTGEVVSIMPGIPRIEPYTSTRCRNPRCPVVYSILSIVELSAKYKI